MHLKHETKFILAFYCSFTACCTAGHVRAVASASLAAGAIAFVPAEQHRALENHAVNAGATDHQAESFCLRSGWVAARGLLRGDRRGGRHLPAAAGGFCRAWGWGGTADGRLRAAALCSGASTGSGARRRQARQWPLSGALASACSCPTVHCLVPFPLSIRAAVSRPCLMMQSLVSMCVAAGLQGCLALLTDSGHLSILRYDSALGRQVLHSEGFRALCAVRELLPCRLSSCDAARHECIAPSAASAELGTPQLASLFAGLWLCSNCLCRQSLRAIRCGA